MKISEPGTALINNNPTMTDETEANSRRMDTPNQERHFAMQPRLSAIDMVMECVVTKQIAIIPAFVIRRSLALASC
jgi:hypothetical protein